MIGALEIYAGTILHNIDHSKLMGDELNSYSEYNDLLGYAPKKNVVKPVESYYGDELLYSVTYSINEKGIRISTPGQEKTIPNQKCVVFFGGSFTFGHGVEDNQTFPYLVSLKSGGKYRTYNLGFNGWGAHHMLSILEHNLEKEILECEPDFAIYQALVNHVDRATGRGSWDKNGPNYVIDDNGDIVYEGKFSESNHTDQLNSYISDNIIFKYLYKSRIFRKIAPRAVLTMNRSSNVDRYLAIIEKAKTIFEHRYPGSEFYIILWDDPKFSDISVSLIHKSLLEKGIKVFLVSDMLPDYRNNPGQYRLSPNDRHPAPLAYDLISSYTIENILKEQTDEKINLQ